MANILKLLFTGFLSIAFYLTLYAQDSTEVIEKNAVRYLSAMVENDYNRLAEMTHPTIVAMGGGVDALVKSMEEEAVYATPYSAPKILKISEIYVSETDRQAVVTYAVIVQIEQTKFNATRNLLAVSLPDKEDWYFLDLELYDKDSLKMFVPNLHTGITIPESAEPLLIETKQ